MIGYILLFIALILYFQPSTRVYSIFLYIGFLRKGYQLLTDDVIGVKNGDLAIIYTVVIQGTLFANGLLNEQHHGACFPETVSENGFQGDLQDIRSFLGKKAGKMKLYECKNELS